MKKKKGNYRRTLILGFAAVYVVCMCFMTYIAKANIQGQQEMLVWDSISTISKEIGLQKYQTKEDGSLTENAMEALQCAMLKPMLTGKKVMVNFALMDEQGAVVTKVPEEKIYLYTMLNQDDTVDAVYCPEVLLLESYFTEKEQQEIYQLYEQYGEIYGANKGTYVCEMSFNEKKQLLNYGIKAIDGPLTDSSLSDVNCETLFQWTNRKIKGAKQWKEDAHCIGDMSSYVFSPYLLYGKEYLDKWKNDAELQDFTSEIATEEDSVWSFRWKQFFGNEIKQSREIIEVLGTKGEKTKYQLVTNYRLYPWSAALERLGNMYLFSACFAILCGGIVFWSVERTYQKQEQLEEMRRDFTNAAAHELKTPLAIIRGLSENMDREQSAEKNAYYRKELVHQTEKMDELIKEMIVISKLDGAQIVLKREPISVQTVAKSQMENLKPLVQEKKLHIHYSGDEDCIIVGDISYIEKALFNLLENAVTYNEAGGSIVIHTEKNAFVIENTAKIIPEEDMAHIFDLFYTGNKSRTSREDQKGLGLYLVKRIMDLHGWQVEAKIKEGGYFSFSSFKRRK